MRQSTFRKKYFHQQAIAAYLFLLPNFIGFALFTAFPVIAALLLGFTSWDGFNEIKWIGLDNYQRLLHDDNFLISFKNTIIYTFASCLLMIVISISLALIVNQKMRGISFFRAAYFFPHIVSFVAIAVVWQAIYHPTLGPINMVLKTFMQTPPGWLSHPGWALPALIIVTVWKSSGYYMILFLAGLQGIPESLYEAAKIDGAGKFRQFRSVTLPLLSPVTFLVLITSIINLFKSFDLVYIMTAGGPGRSTSLLVYDIFVQGFRFSKFGYASAEAVFLFAIVLAITMIQFRGQKRWVNFM